MNKTELSLSEKYALSITEAAAYFNISERMGDMHGDISVTMNTYTHVNYDNAKEEMENLFGKQVLRIVDISTYNKSNDIMIKILFICHGKRGI